MRVMILNWTKIQGRKGIQNPSWFAFKNKFFYDSNFFKFSHEEKVVWLYLLCEASLQNKGGMVTVDNEHAIHMLKISNSLLKNCLKKLKELRIVELKTSHGRYMSVKNLAPTLQDSTEQDRTRHNNTGNVTQDVTRAPRFDFEFLYKKYPRKEGKQKGIKLCQMGIKTDKDYQDLSDAIDRYVIHCKEKVSDAKYVKHFSTFMSSWRDWLDPDVGTASTVSGDIDWSKLT